MLRSKPCVRNFVQTDPSFFASTVTHLHINEHLDLQELSMYVRSSKWTAPGGTSVSDSPPHRTMGNGNGTRSRNGAKVQPEPVTSSLRLTCYFLTLSSRHGRAAPGNNVSSSQPRSRDCFLVLDNGVGDRAANRVRQSRQDLAWRVWNSQEPEQRLANNHWRRMPTMVFTKSLSMWFFIFAARKLHHIEVQSRLIHRGKENSY